MEHLVTFAQGEVRQRGARVGYAVDPCAWALEQAQLLRQGRFDQLDILNIADEIADVARRELEALESDLTRIVQHLLKWDAQPGQRSRSWVNSVKEHRRRVEKRLNESPSLRGHRQVALAEAFRRGRAEALIDTGLPDNAFPSSSMQSWDEIMTRSIEWPDEP